MFTKEYLTMVLISNYDFSKKECSNMTLLELIEEYLLCLKSENVYTFYKPLVEN